MSTDIISLLMFAAVCVALLAGYPVEVPGVTVNRLWEQFFGAGLVRTSEDFGMQGEWPSHPELLDWLAVEFRQSWDVQAMIRLIVTSSTYRQSARLNPAAAQVDPENRLLASFPRQRMAAEQIRDQALFVSGLLVEHLGGILGVVVIGVELRRHRVELVTAVDGDEELPVGRVECDRGRVAVAGGEMVGVGLGLVGLVGVIEDRDVRQHRRVGGGERGRRAPRQAGRLQQARDGPHRRRHIDLALRREPAVAVVIPGAKDAA